MASTQDCGQLGKGTHDFNLMGGWLANEDTMTRIYEGLHAKPKRLHVPDISALCRRSDLSQKSQKGTVFTEGVAWRRWTTP